MKFKAVLMLGIGLLVVLAFNSASDTAFSATVKHIHIDPGQINNSYYYTNGTANETDPFWTGNYTACAAGNHLYFSGGNLACEVDQVGGGGTGAPHLVDNGTYFSLNASYAVNFDVQGYITSSNWSDVSITESQVSDLGSYIEAESDPYWTANQSSYSTTADMNTAIGAANTSMKGYVDGQGFLTSYTESDPFWTGNYTACAAGNHLYFSSGNLACESDDDTQLTQEQVEDYAGGMWTGNTETRATVTYQGADNTIDIVVDDMNDDTPDDDSEVPDDITVDTTKWVNSTQGFEICNGANCWKFYVNGSDYLIIEEV